MDVMPNEPMAFRGILWGQRLESLTGRTFVKVKEEGNFASYRLKEDPLKIGGTKVSDIVYCFYRGRFYRVSVVIDTREEFEKIKKYFFENHGEGVSVSREETETYYWAGAELDISLEFSGLSGGFIEYSFRPIHKEEEKIAKRQSHRDWEK
jgi:hypothetical protein